MIRTALFFMAGLAALPASAGSWLAPNGYRVEGGPQSIVVHPLAGAGGGGIFCAAASYALDRLSAAPSDSVVVTAPRSGRLFGPGGETVGFRLDPSAAPDHGLFLKVSRQGEAMTVAHARSLCGDDIGS